MSRGLSLDREGRLRIPEADRENQIAGYLEAEGWIVIRTNRFAGGVILRQGSLEPGIPDLLAIRPVDGAGSLEGRIAWRMEWIEVKCPGKGLNKHQAEWWKNHPTFSKRIAFSADDVADLRREL